MTNIVRHARASEVDVHLRLTPSDFSMRVSDDGVGMEATVPQKMNSFGLLGVKERVRGFGGELTMGTGDKGGACLNIVVPAPEPRAGKKEARPSAECAAQSA